MADKTPARVQSLFKCAMGWIIALIWTVGVLLASLIASIQLLREDIKRNLTRSNIK